MASQILGLFTSPEQYRAMQDQQGENAAIQYAQLTPFQRADVSLYTGGRQLGQVAGSLFGVQDPQLRKITMRQQMMTGAGGNPRIDMNDPNSIRRAAVVAQEQGDPEFAMALNDYARKAEGEMALIQQRTKEGRAAAIPKELQIASARAELQDTIARLEADQVANPNDANIARALAVAKSTLAGLPVKTEGLVREQQIARDLALSAGPEGSEAYNAAYGKNLRDLTTKTTQEKLGEFERVLNARYPDTPENADKRAQLMDQFLTNEITGRKAKGSTEVKLTLPGQDKAGVKGVSEFRNSVIDTVKPFRNTVTSADQAIQSINDSLKTGNFISFNAARTQLAKALGDGTLSRRDVEQAGGDPSILGGLADTASTMFTGTPTADTQKKIKSTLMAIRKVAREKGANELAIQRQIAQQSGYDENQMKTIFNFPEFETKGQATPSANRTNETIPANVASRISTAPAAPVKGQPQIRTLKSGKKVTVEME